MPKSNPGVDLSRHLLDALVRARDAGHYPIPLAELLREVADAPPELLAKALVKAPFKAGAIVSIKGVESAPVAVNDEDGVQRLAIDPQLLRGVLTALSDFGPAPWGIAKIVAKVSAALKKPFKAALEQQLRDGALPSGVGVVTKGKTSSLYLKERPPPAIGLADRLVDALEGAKRQGPYPLPFATLLDRLGADPETKMLNAALKQPALAKRVLWVVARNNSSPVAFLEDFPAIATSATLLDYLFGSARTAATTAFKAAELAKKVASPLRKELTATLNAVEADRLPPSAGFVLIKGVRYFHAVANLAAKPPHSFPPERKTADEPDFERDFDAAFERLDRARGGLNFVSLVDLRRELDRHERAEFDAGLLALRRDRRYTLKAAEGLDGLNAAELAAGIREDGDLLLNVSRIHP